MRLTSLSRMFLRDFVQLNSSDATVGRWVFFREDTNTHKEVYLAEVSPNGDVALSGKQRRTDDPRLAMSFPTARAAYEFGRAWGLDHWHVGQR